METTIHVLVTKNIFKNVLLLELSPASFTSPHLCVHVSPALLNARKSFNELRGAGTGYSDTAADSSVFCLPAATRSDDMI